MLHQKDLISGSMGEVRKKLLVPGLLALERRFLLRLRMCLKGANRTEDIKHQRNANDFNEFIIEISKNKILKIEPGIIYGPITVPGNPILISKVDLFIGKVFRNIRGAEK